ncbi:MAG: DUF368 domain-containing protein [Bacteroidales bacterium]|nr:DUF368 domain-containing protein [Bacteroidales bacterium]
MNALTKNILTGLKGFGMGAANVIPGVSGGTIALLTGIFTEIIDALNALMDPSSWKMLLKGQFREFWRYVHGTFLVSLLVGVLISIFSLAKLMVYVMHFYPVQTWAFFFGLIIASSVYMIYDIKGWKFVDVLFFAVGIALGVVICTLSPTTTPDDLWFIFICGAIAVCTMILPGISGSFILVILGKYDYIMQSVNQLNLPVLLVFGIGCVIGILGFSKFLHWLLKRYERATMLTLVGFVIGALVKVWPWNDMTAVAEGQLLRSGMTAESAQAGAQALLSAGNAAQGIDLQIPGAIIWAIAGLALVAVLEYLSSLQKLMAEKKN